jgi:hypothetical protein
VDEIGALRLELEDLHHKREAELCSDIGGEGAIEDDLNALWDRLVAVMIELQQKEDGVEMKRTGKYRSLWRSTGG